VGLVAVGPLIATVRLKKMGITELPAIQAVRIGSGRSGGDMHPFGLKSRKRIMVLAPKTRKEEGKMCSMGTGGDNNR